MPQYIPERRRVFLAIPLQAAHTDAVVHVLDQVCRSRNLDLHKGDFPSDELHPRLVQELERAEVVIADLTGCRPNVIYELGYARALGKRVVLISEKSQEPPADLAGVISIPFEFDEQAEALIAGGSFWQDMERTLDDALLSEAPIVLKDVDTRTAAIVKDLDRLERAAHKGEIGFMEVACSGFLSPLAIGDEDADAQFHDEKRALTGLIERGCVFRAIICPINEVGNPPSRETIELGRLRTRTLLAYLQDPVTANYAIEIVVSTVMQKNLYVIGNISCIEGFRTGPGQFRLSLRQTGVDVVGANRQLFNVMFDSLAESEISSLPLRSPDRLSRRIWLRRLAIKRLESSLKYLD